jgi:hypothetical protein
MKVIRHTLVSEGSTDANLIPIIDWTLKHTAGLPLSQGKRAEFWRLSKKPGSLGERILKAVELDPCEILFIHRDADGELPQARVGEIRQAIEQAGIKMPAVAIIPVRMLEAWLCFNEVTIRKASGNPNGKVPLNLPAMKRVESRPDPKRDLREALLTASERSGRRRKRFDTAAAFWLIVDGIEDFSPLRELPSFQAFERSVKFLKDNNLRPGFYG